MKIHLVTAEHFSTPGLIQKAFAIHPDAVTEAAELVEVMLGDSAGVEWEPVTDSTWESVLWKLQDYHGAAHCYVEITELEVAGRDPLAALLKEAVEYEADQFDGDPDMPLEVSGADTVDWLTDFRIRARKALKRFGVEA